MRITKKSLLIMSIVAAMSPLGLMAAQGQPSVEEQMSAMQKMCIDTTEVRTARHQEKALYERLGGYDRIHELTKEIVRRHKINEEIKHMFVHADSEKLAKHVADFVAAGTGGSAQYTGRDMPTSHAALKLTDKDFLSAGGDIAGSMQSLGHGQNEIDEMICILVSLKDQVVFE